MGMFPVNHVEKGLFSVQPAFTCTYTVLGDLPGPEPVRRGGKKAAADLSVISGLSLWRRLTHCLFIVGLPGFLSWEI